MTMYLKYLKSLMLHKWYVFLAGIKTGVPLWRLIVHDWSKFSPAEFGPYAWQFFGEYPSEDRLHIRFPSYTGRTKESVAIDFDYAWLHHQNTNPHHWQYWILVYDDDPRKRQALIMPETYVREMVADWMGASRAYTGSWDMTEWLAKNWGKFEENMHPTTLAYLRAVLFAEGYSLDTMKTEATAAEEVTPTESGLTRWPPDGYYYWDDDERIPCTCVQSCESPCRGTWSGCQCEACTFAYGDFLETE